MSTVFAASASMLVTAGASQAVGSTTADPSPSDPSVVVAYPEAGTGDHAGETFYPTGEISDDTTVVIANADGSLPGGVSLQQVKQQLAQQRAAVAAGKATADSGVAIPDAKSATTQSALPSWASPNTLLPAASGGHSYATIYNVWSKQYHGVNFLGGTDSTKINYVFNVTESTNQEAAG
ncbi:hypothetical protein [Luteimicrobium xylanilyticum]|uniref:hypothetical protein n=1 Tax=Luteimicrobium xylanilyticum TaxID=1133546 RepID=UPI0011D29B5E|nr:hypothetical protein [Luteimicrobium xylanilyticum]